MRNHGTPDIKERERTNTYKIQGDITIVTVKDGRTFIIDTADLEQIKRYSWCFNKSGGYLVANVCGKIVRLHRYLLNPERHQIIDHINGDPSDNRRCNLRICTPKENARNVNVTWSNKSGIVGVKQIKSGKFVAQIMVDRKTISLGHFSSLEEAAEARKKAEIQYYGEFSPALSRTRTSNLATSE
jgi:hypothetical protein